MRKSDERFLNWEAQRISHILKRLVTHRMHSRKLNDWREPQARLMRNARRVNHVINRPSIVSTDPIPQTTDFWLATPCRTCGE